MRGIQVAAREDALPSSFILCRVAWWAWMGAGAGAGAGAGCIYALGGPGILGLRLCGTPSSLEIRDSADLPRLFGAALSAGRRGGYRCGSARGSQQLGRASRAAGCAAPRPWRLPRGREARLLVATARARSTTTPPTRPAANCGARAPLIAGPNCDYPPIIGHIRRHPRPATSQPAIPTRQIRDTACPLGAQPRGLQGRCPS